MQARHQKSCIDKHALGHSDQTQLQAKGQHRAPSTTLGIEVVLPTSSCSSLRLMFHSCCRPCSGPLSTTATLCKQLSEAFRLHYAARQSVPKSDDALLSHLQCHANMLSDSETTRRMLNTAKVTHQVTPPKSDIALHLCLCCDASMHDSRAACSAEAATYVSMMLCHSPMHADTSRCTRQQQGLKIKHDTEQC